MSAGPSGWGTPAESPTGGRCRNCGGALSDPISGDLHCFVVCTACGARYPLDDPAADRPSGP